MQKYAAARIGKGAHQEVQLVFSPDVNTASRVEQEEDAALREKPFGHGDLLLVSSGKGAGHLC